MRLVDQAARNNAEWCATIARLHGVRSTFTKDAWVAASRTPTGYPELVTLSSAMREAAVLELIDHIDGGAIDGGTFEDSVGCSIKDSFATLDLEALGFVSLFEASWIALRADVADPPPVENGWRWSVANSARACEGMAPIGEVMPARLLSEPGVSIVAAHDGERLVGSAVLNHTGAVVGVSTVRVTDAGAHSAAAMWVGIARAARELHPSLTLLGYEAGAQLLAPLSAGFSEIGPLRVWLRA